MAIALLSVLGLGLFRVLWTFLMQEQNLRVWDSFISYILQRLLFELKVSFGGAALLVNRVLIGTDLGSPPSA